MAPEQWVPRDLGPVGPPADVWGLGATLYNALTGIKPFPSSDEDEDAGVERYERRLAELPTMGRRVPAALEELVWSCLRIDPTQRPTPNQLASGLEPFVAAIPKRPVLSRLRPRI
jgi:serine/threonine-protein kinase